MPTTSVPTGRSDVAFRRSVRALAHDLAAQQMLVEHLVAHDSHGHDAAVRASLAESRRLLGELAQLAQGGTLDYTPERVELREVVDEVLQEQATLIQRRGFRVRLGRDLHACWAHRGRVKQVVVNLVRNALLHGGDASAPTLSISVEAGERRAIVLSVHDNGPGIDPSMHEIAFEPGRRVGSTSPGSGLGLSIVRQIAEEYGGRAVFDSLCRQGTAVLVELPAMPAQRAIPTLRDARGRRWKVQTSGHADTTREGDASPAERHRHGR